MDKIRQLLLKCGMNEESANKICESFESHANQLKAKNEQDFKLRLEQAKKACLEETNAHKAELSRRVQIFLEAKNAAIEESIQKHTADRETESVAKLEQIKSLVEGIELDGRSNSELKAEVEKLRSAVTTLSEQRDMARTKVKRVTTLAEKVLNRNKTLERTLAESRSRKDDKRLENVRSNKAPQRSTIKEDKNKPVQSNNIVMTPEQIAESLQELI